MVRKITTRKASALRPASKKPAPRVKITKAAAINKLLHGMRDGAPKSELTIGQNEQLATNRAKAVGSQSMAGHGIVRARAGTGKTFTLVLSVAWVFRDMVIPGYMTNKGGKPRGMTLWEVVAQKLGFVPVPSAQQQAVWDFIASGEKPWTIRYLAFNAGIVEDFSNQYKWLTEALRSVGIDFSFSTVHSLGNAACRRAYNLKGWGSVNKYKVRDLLSALWQVDLMEVWKEKAETINAIEELVALCKLTNPYGTSPDDGVLQELADHYGIMLNGDRDKVYQDVRVLLGQCRDVKPGSQIDFNDQVWLPVVNRLKLDCGGAAQFDLVLGDEAQDWNRCQQEIILRAGKRLIVVGDDRQAIYGFAGADTDSIDRMKGLLGGAVGGYSDNTTTWEESVPEFPLTVTRRCGKSIVAAVNHLVPDFEAHANNGEGLVRRVDADQFAVEVKEADMVLCRVNAPLVGYAFRLIKAGRRANIIGRDIGQGLKSLIKKSKTGDVSEFLMWLDGYYQKEAERLQKRRNPDAEALVTLQDRVECLRMFCDGAITIKELNAGIDKVFRGKVCPKCQKSYDEKTRECYGCKCQLVKPDGTSFSSIHRAKGSEANRVFLLRPDLLPHPMAKTLWARGQEANLEYVAKTRAKNELVIVEGVAADEDSTGEQDDE